VNVSRLTKPDWWQERLRSAPSARCGAALLILLALGVPVHADDPIAEWLKQNESEEQNDQVRPDLHALTDQQLQDIFKIGRDQEDSHELIEGGREQYPRLVYIWFVTIAAGFGAAIGTVKAMPFVVRRRLRTLASSVSKWFPAYLTQITCRLRRRPNPSNLAKSTR
jgi:plasmid stabilization system protein ParE